MNTAAAVNRNKLKIAFPNIVIGFMLICSLLTGIVPQVFLSIIIAGLCVCLFLFKNIYLAYPFMIFYYEFYGKIFGISVYRVFTLIFLAAVLLKMACPQNKKNTMNFDMKIIIPIIIYLFYSIAVTMGRDPRSALFDFVDIICSALIVGGIISVDSERLRKFFKIYIFVALAAFISGMIAGNRFVGKGYLIEISRFNATFEDPNYMGFFYTIAVFALLTLKLYKPIVRYLLIITMYIIIFSSISITAIVVNLILWIVYLLFSGRLNIKIFSVTALLVATILSLYSFGLENRTTPVIGALSYRIEEKINDFKSGDINAVTTSRANLTKQHIEYFVNQSSSRKMFGGTSVSASYIDPALYKAAHNEYVDMLLNIGVLGTILMLGFLVLRTLKIWQLYRKTQDEYYLCLLMNKLIWFAYAFTLTVFMDYRFMLLFFM